MYLEHNVCAQSVCSEVSTVWGAAYTSFFPPPVLLCCKVEVQNLFPNHKSAVTKCELRRNFSVSWSYLWLPSVLSLFLDIHVKNRECITWFGYNFTLDKVTSLILAFPEGEFLCTVVHLKFWLAISSKSALLCLRKKTQT